MENSTHPSSTEQSSQQQSKKKSTIACEFCRKHHRKCDGGKPCKSCNEKGVECIYTARKKRGPKNDAVKRMREELESLKTKLEDASRGEHSWRTKYLEVVQGGSAVGTQGPSSFALHPTSSDSSPTAASHLGNQISNASSFLGALLGAQQPSSSTTTFEEVFIDEDEDDELAPKRRRTSSTTSSESSSPTTVDRRKKPQKVLFVDFHLSFSETVSQFIYMYEKFLHPARNLLPVSADTFVSIVPEILSNMTKGSEGVEDSFYMYCIMSNSAVIAGDRARGLEFAQQARLLAGDLFDTVDYRVGCGFSLLGYFYLGQADFDKMFQFTAVAKSISDRIIKQKRSGSPNSSPGNGSGSPSGGSGSPPSENALLDDLQINCLLALAYSDCPTEEKLEHFQKMGRGSKRGDLIFSLVGQVEAQLNGKRDVNWTNLINMLLQAQKLTSDPYPGKNNDFHLLHELLVYGSMTKALHRTGLHHFANAWAEKVVALSSNANFKYLCVGVLIEEMKNVADFFIDQKNWSAIRQVIAILAGFAARFPLVTDLLTNLTTKLSEETSSALGPSADIPINSHASTTMSYPMPSTSSYNTFSSLPPEFIASLAAGQSTPQPQPRQMYSHSPIAASPGAPYSISMLHQHNVQQSHHNSLDQIDSKANVMAQIQAVKNSQQPNSMIQPMNYYASSAQHLTAPPVATSYIPQQTSVNHHVLQHQPMPSPSYPNHIVYAAPQQQQHSIPSQSFVQQPTSLPSNFRIPPQPATLPQNQSFQQYEFH